MTRGSEALQAMAPLDLDELIEGVVNLRDLGGHRAGDHVVRTGLVYRAGMTHHLSTHGLRALVETLGIRTVIDFRSAAELARDGMAPFAAVGIQRRHLPASEQAGMSPEAIAARRAAFRAGTLAWDEIYLRMTESGAEAYRGTFEALADAEALPVLFHCAAGRDRTGVAAALILALLGVDDEVIAQEYNLSGARLMRHIDRFAGHFTDLQMEREAFRQLLLTTEEPMRRFLAALRTRHGSVPAYLERIGVGTALQARVRALLLEPAA